MDPRRDTAARSTPTPPGRLIPSLSALLLTLAMGACQGPQNADGWHGDEQFLAVYRMGTLHSTLPPEIPVHSVIAAAEMALERRGYTVTSQDATDDRGHVTARPNDGRQINKVEITARLVDGGTGVSIRTYPGGHEHVARDLLERMLTRLGH
jgi:hypothetical protein